MSPPRTADFDELGAEFSCACSVEVSPEWAIAMWQCSAGDNCPNWQLITRDLERCLRQLRIHALGRDLPAAGAGPGAGGSL